MTASNERVGLPERPSARQGPAGASPTGAPSGGQGPAATVPTEMLARARPAHVARSRPDPRPGRLMIGAGAVAALTIIGSGLVRVPLAGEEVAQVEATRTGTSRVQKVERPVRYVRLKPGQKAPPGARVIQEAAPAPRVVVRLVPPTRTTVARPTSRQVVTRTRQSGG